MSKGPTSSLLGDMTSFASSTLLRQAIGLVNSLVKPLLLSPENFGIWTVLSVIPTYAGYFDIGSRAGMRIQIPLHDGDELQQEVCKSSVLFYTLFLHLAVAVGIVLTALFGPFDRLYSHGLLFVSVLVMTQWHYGYILSSEKGYANFGFVSKLIAFRALLGSALNVLLIWLFDIYGLFVATTLTAVLTVLWAMRVRPLPVWRHVSFPAFKSAMLQGLPLMLFALSSIVMRTLDRFVIVGMLGTQAVGYYGIAVMAFTFIMIAPGAAQEVVEPRVMSSVGAGRSREALDEFFFSPMLNLAYYFPLVVGLGILATPPMVEYVLPRYAPSVRAAQLLLSGSYFLALAYISRGILIGLGLVYRAVAYILVAAAFNLAVSVGLVKLGFGVAGVSAGSAMSYLVFLLLILHVIRKRFPIEPGAWRRVFLALALPFPVLASLCYGLILLSRQLPLIPGTLLAMLLFTPAAVLVIFVGSRLHPMVVRPSLNNLLHIKRTIRRGGKRRQSPADQEEP